MFDDDGDARRRDCASSSSRIVPMVGVEAGGLASLDFGLRWSSCSLRELLRVPPTATALGSQTPYYGTNVLWFFPLVLPVRPGSSIGADSYFQKA